MGAALLSFSHVVEEDFKDGETCKAPTGLGVSDLSGELVSSFISSMIVVDAMMICFISWGVNRERNNVDSILRKMLL